LELLAQIYESDQNYVQQIQVSHPLISKVVEVANILNCIVVRKGPIDLITDGKEAILVGQPGSLKRCGGIGDILSGVIGTFAQYSIREERPFTT
jgi:ATP-dependent NAD(P)H-hydrate dehydratase